MDQPEPDHGGTRANADYGQTPIVTFGYDPPREAGDKQIIMKCTELGGVCCLVEATVEDMAEEYVRLLSTPANGWGQYVHPVFGQSHTMMIIMTDRWGSGPTQEAISQALAKGTRNADQA